MLVVMPLQIEHPFFAHPFAALTSLIEVLSRRIEQRSDAENKSQCCPTALFRSSFERKFDFLHKNYFVYLLNCPYYACHMFTYFHGVYNFYFPYVSRCLD